jgi:hypothetical protein
MMNSIGKKSWAISGGHIPLKSTGDEPEFTSHDRISILNTGSTDAQLKLMVYYEDQDPIGPYSIIVKARRVCKIHLNELINPLPIPLNKPFACLIDSDVPIVIQFLRMNTSSDRASITGTIAFSSD